VTNCEQTTCKLLLLALPPGAHTCYELCRSCRFELWRGKQRSSDLCCSVPASVAAGRAALRTSLLIDAYINISTRLT